MSDRGTSVATTSLPRAIGLAFCIQTVISFVAAVAPVIAVEVAAVRQWDVIVISLYLPLLYAVAFGASFGIPFLLAKWGPIRLGVACITLAAAGELALLGADWRMVVLAPLTIGLSVGGMNPITSQILSQHASPRNAAFVTALKQTGVPFGAAAAGLVGPLLVHTVGLKSSIVSIAMATFLIAVSLIPVARGISGQVEHGLPRPARLLEPIKELIAIPGMISVIIAATTYVGAQFCLRSFLTIYFARDLGLTLSFAGFAFTVSQASGIAGQLVWASLCRRAMTYHGVLVGIGVLMAVASGATACATGTWQPMLLLALSALFGFTAAGFVPVVLGMVMATSPAGQAGAFTSALNIFLIGSSLLGPLAFGGVARGFGYASAFFALALVCGAGALSCAVGYMVSSSGAGATARQSMPAG
jgi:MFS family permease